MIAVGDTSAAVRTARTPGKSRARLVSIETRRACACDERSTAACSIPGTWTSSTKRARPATNRSPPIRACDSPIMRCLPAADSERLAQTAVRLQRVAVLLVTGGVMRARQQERLAVALGITLVVVQQAERDLLVVRVVAVLERVERELTHECIAVVATREVRARPRHALIRLHRDLGGVDALE